jgi:hypothetical protein
MIIIVKVNGTYISGTDPKHAACQAWNMGRLLRDSTFRNQYKFLVAIYYGQIIGTFCIHGISLAFPNAKQKKVKFLLNETDYQCDKYLRGIIQKLIDNREPKILNQNDPYFNLDYLLTKVEFENYKCACSIDKIPVLEPDEIAIIKNDQLEKPIEIKIRNLWFKLTISWFTFDSHRRPVNKERIDTIYILPGGKIKYNRSDDSKCSKIISIDRKNKSIIYSIITSLHFHPKESLKRINNSHIEKHVSHINTFEVEFETFKDEKLTIKTQYEKWSGNVLYVKNGFLKLFYELIS